MDQSGTFKWWPYVAFCLICVVATGVVCQRIVADAIARQAEADRLAAAGVNSDSPSGSDQHADTPTGSEASPASDASALVDAEQSSPPASVRPDQKTPAPVVILMAESLPISIAAEPGPVDALLPENSEELVVATNESPAAVPPKIVPAVESSEEAIAGEMVADATLPENTTAFDATNQPAWQPVTDHDLAMVALGRELFMHVWKPNDPLAGGDGLGPVFNGTSCVQCHFQGAEGGSGSNAHNVKTFEVLPRRNGDHILTGVIHAQSVGREKDSSRSVREMYPERVKTARRTVPALREVDINTPPLWGNGLIDKLTNQQLVEHHHAAAVPHGRLRRLSEGRLGRFGWKGQFATLHEFVAGACANEIGLSNAVAQQMLPDQYQPDLSAAHDLTETQVDAMVKYVASLPAPRQVMPSDNEHRSMAERGRRYFGTIGCTKCHPHNIGDLRGVFSDFQLHDVIDPTQPSGAEYYTSIAAGPLVVQPPKQDPSLTEWKTPPLWGVSDTAPYWHDGSASTLKAAILKHAEEAAPVRENFLNLSEKQQDCVIEFLHTLKAPVIPELSDPQAAN